MLGKLSRQFGGVQPDTAIKPDSVLKKLVKPDSIVKKLIKPLRTP